MDGIISIIILSIFINIQSYPIFIYCQYLSIFIVNIPCLSIFINMPYKIVFFRLTMFWNLSGSDFRQEVRSILADIGLSPQNREEKFEARKPGRTTAGAHGALGPRFWDLGDHEQRFSGQSKRRFVALLFVPELAI